MKSKDEIRVRVKWLLIITVTFLGVYLGFRFILPLILPFVLAYFLAWIIRPMTEFLYKRVRMARIIGGTLSLLLVVGIAGTGIFYLIKTLLRQAVAFLRNFPIYMSSIVDRLDYICGSCDKVFGLTDGTMRTVMDDHMMSMLTRVKTDIIPGITEQTISITIKFVGAIGILLIILVSTILIAKDLPVYKERYEKSDIYQDIHKVTKKLSEAGIAYIRAQVSIAVIVAFFCVLGLTILRNEYALLIGVGIAIMDAFPVLGSGLILIPWSIIMLLNGNIYAAAILLTIFLLCQIIREVLEPRLIGNRIGIKPIFTLMSIYIGLQLFSFAGFFLGPIGLIMIITIVKAIYEKNDKGSDQKPEETGKDGGASDEELKERSNHPVVE
ncbi:MAG: putative rane protein [Herbinix sp.]|nr:putative rane protein [Herbinix sp.]